MALMDPALLLQIKISWGTTTEPFWLWELLKILLPILTTVGVGWYLGIRTERLRSQLGQDAERLKSQLSHELVQFQTRDSLLHAKQAEAIEELYAAIARAEAFALAAQLVFDHPGPFPEKEAPLDDELAETLNKLNDANVAIMEVFLRKQILLPPETCELIQGTVFPLLTVENKFWKFIFARKQGPVFDGKTAEIHWQESVKALREELPAIKNELRSAFTAILSPANTEKEIVRKPPNRTEASDTEKGD